MCNSIICEWMFVFKIILQSRAYKIASKYICFPKKKKKKELKRWKDEIFNSNTGIFYDVISENVVLYHCMT